MLRTVCAAVMLCVMALPVWANARVTLLMDAMQLRDVLSIQRTEGLDYGASLDADMLEGRGGPFLAAQLDRIYDIDQMQEVIRHAIETGMDDAALEDALGFFSSPRGARIIALETVARAAISDPAVEEAALARYAEMADADSPLMRLVAGYIEANDLIEWNVSGAMSANFQFYKGLSDGGYHRRSETEILEEVWSQQQDIRTDTENWLWAYLLMSYQPLAEDDLKAYVAFSQSDAGRALNAALFNGFEQLYGEISYTLGRAIALLSDGDEI